jgi:hypothetical protein
VTVTSAVEDADESLASALQPASERRETATRAMVRNVMARAF